MSWNNKNNRNNMHGATIKILKVSIKITAVGWSRQCVLYATLKPCLISSILSSVSDPAYRHEEGQTVDVLVPTGR
jgi:hypothetical protein